MSSAISVLGLNFRLKVLNICQVSKFTHQSTQAKNITLFNCSPVGRTSDSMMVPT